jgi:hypothetical protein
MSEWRPYFIRRKTSPSMSLSQPQSYHMSPSMEQGSHFSTDSSRIHGGFPNSSAHFTGSNNIWPGDEWMLQAASGLRTRPAPDHNSAPSVPYDHQSFFSYPALGPTGLCHAATRIPQSCGSWQPISIRPSHQPRRPVP